MTRKVGNGSPENVAVALEPVSTGAGRADSRLGSRRLIQTILRPTPDRLKTPPIRSPCRYQGQGQPITYDVIVFDPDVAGSDFEEPVTAGSVNPVVGNNNTYKVDVGSLTDQFQWRFFELSNESQCWKTARMGTRT